MTTPWPNQQPVKDGVEEANQDPSEFADVEADD